MKKIVLFALAALCLSLVTMKAYAGKSAPQKLGIVISSSDPETVFNALRLANFSLSQGDQVKVFLIGKGVDLDKIDDKSFNVKGLAEEYQNAGGKIMACGTCLKMHNSAGSKLCPLSTMKTLYDIIRESDKVVSF